jgi:hypothetical protein
MRKKPSLSALETKLDRVFSEYIRLKDADEGGTVACVTCGKLLFWRDAHCGHFIKRQHRSTRWEPTNCAPQGAECNTFRGGCQDEFAAYIVKRYGLSEFNRLMLLKRQTVKRTRVELEEMIAMYRAKLSELTQKEAA